MKDGKNVYRVLDVETAEGDCYKQFEKHFWNDQNFLCPGRDKCPMCKKGKEILKKKGKDAARPYWPRKQAAFVGVRVFPDKEDEAKIFVVPNSVFQEILTFYADVDEYGPITDLQEGRDLVINRTGKGLKTEYAVSLRDQKKSIKLDEEIMEKLPDLDEEFGEDKFPSAAKIKAIMEGIEYDEDEEEEDEEEDDAPKSKKKSSTKKKAKDEDEDEEEDEEEEDEEEDEPEDSDDDEKDDADEDDADEDDDSDSDNDGDDDDSDSDEDDEEADDDGEEEDEDDDDEPKKKKPLKGKAKAKSR